MSVDFNAVRFILVCFITLVLVVVHSPGSSEIKAYRADLIEGTKDVLMRINRQRGGDLE